MPTKTKDPRALTLHDLLSRLGPAQAAKLLGPRATELLYEGGKMDVDPGEDVELSPERLLVRAEGAEVRIDRADSERGGLRLRCSEHRGPCVHWGAALSLVLEEKMALGLSAPADPGAPIESLSEEQLVQRALDDRAERARTEKMRLRSADPKRPWTDYTVTSRASGKTYRVALRGTERGVSYCSCPDFRKNTLGTCKHILYVLERARRRFSAAELARPYRRRDFSVHLRYGEHVEVRLATPDVLDAAAEKIVRPLIDRPVTDLRDLLRRIRLLENAGHEVRIYPDAEEHIEATLERERLEALAREIREDPAAHPLRRSLLRAELLPYQLDGIAFAVGAGRAILADDMGLGKTIQGIGVAELLAREAGIRRVLVICPTTLKSQWRSEIRRFSERTCQLVVGPAASRAEQYRTGAFFTVCNYEQVLRDILAIERVPWDLIVLDEGQRIKNWEAKTSRIVKALRSRYALVLTGTPLENRLEELYSVVEVVDERRLGPAFRFLHRHRTANEDGKVLGYKNLGELRRRLAPIMLRRTRADVLSQLPPRTTEIVRISPTDEQLELHRTHMMVVRAIVRKPYLTEMDLLRLRKALLMCRLAADGSYLVDKQTPNYSSKLERIGDLLDRLARDAGRKAVLFSEWTTMLGLIEPLLDERGIGYVRLDGSVPQKKRAELVRTFETDDRCALFLTTNAGSAGLNLQVADTVINVDLPWNPAVLEQRIARAHRMGQRRPVHVYVLVTEGTIEENLLATLSAKHELALAALDPESDVEEVTLASGMEELKRRLEVLLGARPDAPVDVSEQRRVEAEAEELARRERVARAAGQVLAGAFDLLGEILPDVPEDGRTRALRERLEASLASCAEVDAEGRVRLSLVLPATDGAAANGGGDRPELRAVAGLARSLARLAAAAGPAAPPDALPKQGRASAEVARDPGGG